MNRTRKIIIAVIFTEIVGTLSAVLSRDSIDLFDSLSQPSIMPPHIVFPIVWAVLFLLMGIGAGIVWSEEDSALKTWSLSVYIIQLFFNFWWSIIFFNYQALGFALIWLLILWLMIILLIVLWSKINKAAAYMQIPYLLWVTFAAYLNYSIWMLNR